LAGPSDYERARADILALAAARVRAAPGDYQIVLKTGEERLSALRAGVKGAPPMETEMRALRGALQRARSRGGQAANADDTEALLARLWTDYENDYSALRGELEIRRDAVSPSQLYWLAVEKFSGLRDQTMSAVLLNPPPGRRSTEEVFLKDEKSLFLWLEPPGARSDCAVLPAEHTQAPPTDISPFFNSQGMLPTVTPQASGAFLVPAGCRTVTRRESNARRIYRVAQGKAKARVGAAEAVLDYGYLAVPPDQPYVFENLGPGPLHLEFIALPPS